MGRTTNSCGSLFLARAIAIFTSASVSFVSCIGFSGVTLPGSRGYRYSFTWFVVALDIRRSAGFSDLSISGSAETTGTISIIFLVLSSIGSRLIFRRRRDITPGEAVREVTRVAFFVIITTFHTLFGFSWCFLDHFLVNVGCCVWAPPFFRRLNTVIGGEFRLLGWEVYFSPPIFTTGTFVTTKTRRGVYGLRRGTTGRYHFLWGCRGCWGLGVWVTCHLRV